MAKETMKSILLVDDDEYVLIALERLLEGEGYRTETAWSAQEALELSQKADFDLLLVDEHLHGADVNTLLDELKQNQPNATPFLMCTRKLRPDHALTKSPAICKWEHGEVKARIRRHFAA